MAYKKGDRVRIIGGNFKGIVGEVDGKIPFVKQYNVKLPQGRYVPVEEKHLTGA